MVRYFYLLALVGIVGCGGRAPEKVVNDATAQPTAGKVDGHFYRLKLARLMDPQGFGQPVEVAHMLIPADWRSEGRVDWVNGQLGCPANIIQPRFRAAAADGRSGLEVMPGRVWQSASDGMMLQTMQQSAAAGTGCEVGPVVDSIQYLEQMVIPRARGGARVVERKPLPGVARAKQSTLEATYAPMVQAGYVRGYKVDAGSVRIEYEHNGQPVEEWLSTSIVSVARPSPNTAALMQGQMNYNAAVFDVIADTVFGLRAPRGSFDERLAATLVASVRPNPAYQAAVGQFLANMGNIQLRGAMDRSRIWSEANAQISATISESYRAQQAVQDRAAENFSQAIRGVQEYKNPRTGEEVQLVGGYDSAWVSPRGEYLVSDTPGFNPGIALHEDWTELTKR